MKDDLRLLEDSRKRLVYERFNQLAQRVMGEKGADNVSLLMLPDPRGQGYNIRIADIKYGYTAEGSTPDDVTNTSHEYIAEPTESSPATKLVRHLSTLSWDRPPSTLRREEDPPGMKKPGRPYLANIRTLGQLLEELNRVMPPVRGYGGPPSNQGGATAWMER